MISEQLLSTTLIVSFLKFKSTPHHELYWYIISKPFNRRQYFTFRIGTLPITPFTCNWSPNADNKCPTCTDKIETLSHVLFACPAYLGPWNKRLQPTCKNLGTRSSSVALRILRSDPSPQYASSVAKFLGWMWLIRLKLSFSFFNLLI